MKTEKARLIKTVIQAIVVVGLGYFIRHRAAETGSEVWIAAGWLLTAWVVLRLAVALKRGYATLRAHTESGVNLETLDKLTTASMQPWMRGFYLVEKRAYRGFWHAITQKPVTPAGEFSVAGGPKGRMLAVALLALVAIGAAVAAAYLPGLVTAFWPRVFAFAGAGYAALYAAVWIVGERRSLKEGGHRIAHDSLILDRGIRCSGAIALDSIAGCHVPKRGQRRKAASDAWTVAPGAPANVLIELNGMTPLAITAFGSPRDISTMFVALYVDRPASFADAVCGAIAPLRMSA